MMASDCIIHRVKGYQKIFERIICKIDDNPENNNDVIGKKWKKDAQTNSLLFFHFLMHLAFC